jgi:hypothetical protein
LVVCFNLDDMAELLGDPQVMRHYPQPKSREHGFGLWLLTLRATGEFVGDCGLTPQLVDGVTELEVGSRVRGRSRVAAWPPKPRPSDVTTPATSSASTG